MYVYTRVIIDGGMRIAMKQCTPRSKHRNVEMRYLHVQMMACCTCCRTLDDGFCTERLCARVGETRVGIVEVSRNGGRRTKTESDCGYSCSGCAFTYYINTCYSFTRRTHEESGRQRVIVQLTHNASSGVRAWYRIYRRRRRICRN